MERLLSNGLSIKCVLSEVPERYFSTFGLPTDPRRKVVRGSRMGPTLLTKDESEVPCRSYNPSVPILLLTYPVRVWGSGFKFVREIRNSRGSEVP